MPAFERQWGQDRTFPALLDWQRRLHEIGWVAPAWPAEIGGQGLGVADQVDCALLLATSGAPHIAGILGVANVGPTLAAWGNDEQRAHLPKILSGEEIWCQGFSEPDAGSDLAGLRCSARADGDDFVIDGQKVWTSQGMEATHCQLLVRTDPDAPKHRGISALTIPLDLPGVERRPLRQITGEADFAELFFTGVRVPQTALLGPLHDGWRVTMTTLAHERAGIISIARQLESETASLVSRYQRDGDRRLDKVSRDELMRRYVDARVLGVLGEVSLAEAVSGGAPGPAQSVMKLFWGLLSQQVADTKVTLAGLDGVFGPDVGADGPARSFLSSRSTTIAGGTTEVMKNILAERVLGLPKDGRP